ncbi:hypothetical protein V1477_011638 [Vespula maculifrons]|uniref:Uncharacterized protein n=1 Tax=Vespula maculifrons TaxID=7453 RepID=A0ABD2BZR7_VESMC
MYPVVEARKAWKTKLASTFVTTPFSNAVVTLKRELSSRIDSAQKRQEFMERKSSASLEPTREKVVGLARSKKTVESIGPLKNESQAFREQYLQWPAAKIRLHSCGPSANKTTIWSKLTRGMCTGVFPRVSLDNTTFTRLCSNCSQLNLSNIRCGTSSRLFYRICNDVDN